jgi:hypothetical protein
VPEKAPEDVSAIFRSKSKSLPPPIPMPPPIPAPAPPAAAPSAAVPSAQQLGGMLNGLVGNVFENNNWWLWAALLFIVFNPDLRKKLFRKGKEAD